MDVYDIPTPRSLLLCRHALLLATSLPPSALAALMPLVALAALVALTPLVERPSGVSGMPRVSAGHRRLPPEGLLGMRRGPEDSWLGDTARCNAA